MSASASFYTLTPLPFGSAKPDSGLVGVHTKGQWGSTPLHWAARNNHLELAKVLISSGAEVNAKDRWGLTPLHRAARNGHKKMQELLISHGGIR